MRITLSPVRRLTAAPSPAHAAPAGLRGSDAPTRRRAPVAVALGRDDLGAADRDRVEGADGPHPMAVPGQARPPGRGRVRLHQHREVLAPPEAEGPGRGGVEGEPGRGDGGRRVLAGLQQAGQELAR